MHEQPHRRKNTRVCKHTQHKYSTARIQAHGPTRTKKQECAPLHKEAGACAAFTNTKLHACTRQWAHMLKYTCSHTQTRAHTHTSAPTHVHIIRGQALICTNMLTIPKTVVRAQRARAQPNKHMYERCKAQTCMSTRTCLRGAN
jgi:hypothetical protein